MISSSDADPSSAATGASDQADASTSAVDTSAVETAPVETAAANHAVAEAPAAIATPAVTEAAAVIEQPAASEQPAVSEQAAVSAEPSTATKAELPSLTEQASATQQPSAMQQPSATQQPFVTQQPFTTAQPAAVPQPEAPKPITETPEPPQPSSDPVIAERISIPANPSSEDSAPEGGEWDLLTAKVTAWWETNDIAEQITRLRQPLRVAAYVIGAVLVLRVYAGLLAAIDNIPLASGLLELVGVCWVARFSATRLVKSQDRAEVIQGLRQRWTSFAGKK